MPVRSLVLAVAVAAAGSEAVAQAARPTAIEHVSVVPMDRPGVLADQTVVVVDGLIQAVGPAAKVATPKNATVVDGHGRYLFPGLTDTHVHLEGNAEQWLPWFLSHGVTTVFNLRGSPDQLALRRRVSEGSLVGPTIYTSGPFTNQPSIMTAADARRAVDDQKAAGYDFVKIHGNLSAEAYAALIAAGRERHLTIVGHAPRNLPFDSVISARQPLVAHAEELIYTKFNQLDTTGIGEVARRMAKAGVWLTPTLTTFSGIVTQWGRPASVDSALALEEDSALPEAIRTFWKGSNPYTGRAIGDWAPRAFQFQLPLVRTLYRAGVPLLTGTDTPLPVMVPGHSLHDEIAQLEHAGVDRVGALRAATVNPGRFIAQFVDPTARFGTVVKGSRADLVLVADNPLERPATLIHPIAVMARGRWFDRTTLDKLVAESGQTVGAERNEPAVEWSAADRNAAVGQFRSETPPLTVRITEREGVLYLEAPGQPAFRMTPVGRRRLAAKGSLTKIEAEFDEAFAVITVTADRTPVAKLTRVP